MEYSKLISVAGLPGLYELVSTKSDGAIVRSLQDGSTRFASKRQHQFSQLENIEIYTQRDNVNLAEVFKAMQANSVPIPDEKDAKAIKSYFEQVYPNIDLERVYISDMKKMLKWYEILKASDLLYFESSNEEVANTIETTPVEEAVAEKPAKKARAKKAVTEGDEATEKPAKKTAAKKKKED